MWESGLEGVLRFLFFMNRPQLLAEARRHGWSGTLLPSSACRLRELKIHAEATSELGTFDYTAYLPATATTAAASDAISLGAVLNIVTNHLGSGPSVALLVRRRGGLDTPRSPERTFLARHATNRSRYATAGRAANRSLLVASVVIRRASRAARSFSDRWYKLVVANPHVREQFCLDVLLQDAATAHPEVALVDMRAAKQLVYPHSQVGRD